MKKTILFTLFAALAITSCSSSGRGVCQKQFECCAGVSRCDDINREGPGFYDRCDIDYSATIDTLGTYGNKACEDIAAKMDAMASCLAGVACSDVSAASGDLGHVIKCDPLAVAYCTALKASGDACGHDYRNLSCDNYTANLYGRGN
jgi:hypothetical protein